MLAPYHMCHSESISSSQDGQLPIFPRVCAGPGVATYFPNEKLEWDAAGLKFKNKPQAAQYIRRSYRQGWEVKGLS